MPTNHALTVTAPGVSLVIPWMVSSAGRAASTATLEFFTARIPNEHTRAAYGRATVRFCKWCSEQDVSLTSLSPPTVAAYVQALSNELSVPSTKVHLAALRHWLDWLTQRGVLPFNPASSVRGPRHVVHEGKTPVLERDEARHLLDSIDGDDIASLRDRALIAVMLFSFARVGAVVQMRVRDFDDEGREAWLALREKGGKARRIPAHHVTSSFLREYIAAAELPPRSTRPLFQSAPRQGVALSGRAMGRDAVWSVVKRRCAAAGLPSTITNHSFRATGITLHQEAGGRIEDAAELAGHSSTRTTQLYNRQRRKVARAEVERVQL